MYAILSQQHSFEHIKQWATFVEQYSPSVLLCIGNVIDPQKSIVPQHYRTNNNKNNNDNDNDKNNSNTVRHDNGEEEDDDDGNSERDQLASRLETQHKQFYEWSIDNGIEFVPMEYVPFVEEGTTTSKSFCLDLHRNLR